MSDPYLGEIRLWANIYTPKDWMACEGQTLAVAQYGALYSLIGVTYGGTAGVNFKLPDLRGRTGLGFSTSNQNFLPGKSGGQEYQTLTYATVPAHTHTLVGDASTGVSAMGYNNYFGIPVQPSDTSTTGPLYTANTEYNAYTLNNETVSSTGGAKSYLSRQPYLVLRYCIAIAGIYPSRS